MKAINIRRFATILLLSLMTLPVCAQGFNSMTVIKSENQEIEKVFVDYEQMPSYPGGDKALMEFFERNLQCPKEVKRAKVRGRVEVSFVIMKDGTVGEVQAIKTVLLKRSGVLCQDSTLIKLCEQEAVRVCNMMQKWIPGRRCGAAFAVKFYFSLTFNDPREELCDFLNSEEICCRCTKEITN